VGAHGFCSALDPRTAYVLHTPTQLWVWLGSAAAAPVREAAAEAAAQLCRYERAPPAQSVHDGEEPVAFWQHFTAADDGAEEEVSKWSCLAVLSWWRPTGGATRLGV